MSFCWFTSFIGYPNFLKNQGNSYELGRAFLTLAQASLSGKTYAESKRLFPTLDHAQVETKKAAFQEFGLLYVTPRSNTITVTPLGKQIYRLSLDRQERDKNRRTILLALIHALVRYQFNNPLPVGGNRYADRAQSSDVLPYLACYYLLLKLDGFLTVSELRGAIFGLRAMADLRKLEKKMRRQRKIGVPFPDLPSLPSTEGTANNLKIYFMAHLSLDGEILHATTSSCYGREEQAFELTQFGYEVVESVLSESWAQWRMLSSTAPRARTYTNIAEYFENGVGVECSNETIQADVHRTETRAARISEGVLDPYDVEGLKQLPYRSFQEGRKRLVQHARLEQVRNATLVREAKRLFKRKHGQLFCEACDFDFADNYGDRGKDYIEAHHKMPIAELEGPVALTIEDLAMVCSNCHRMLHRPPWITIDELREVVQTQRS